jgi:hypothetical protein
MKKLCALWVFLALAAFAACRRQETTEQKNAKIEPEVQQRLAMKHQTQEQQQLAQREAEMNAREKAAATTLTPASSASLSASPESHHAFESQAQKFQPRRIVPMTSPITETSASTPRSSEPPPRD